MIKFLLIGALAILPIAASKNGDFVTGKASFYHNRFDGRKSADGSVFKQNKLTAASNVFPLGSILNIWEEGGDTVQIKVTDRMGKETGKRRILDLSRRAMTEVAGKEGIRKGVIDLNIQQL